MWPPTLYPGFLPVSVCHFIFTVTYTYIYLCTCKHAVWLFQHLQNSAGYRSSAGCTQIFVPILNDLHLLNKRQSTMPSQSAAQNTKPNDGELCTNVNVSHIRRTEWSRWQEVSHKIAKKKNKMSLLTVQIITNSCSLFQISSVLLLGKVSAPLQRWQLPLVMLELS